MCLGYGAMFTYRYNDQMRAINISWGKNSQKLLFCFETHYLLVAIVPCYATDQRFPLCKHPHSPKQSHTQCIPSRHTNGMEYQRQRNSAELHKDPQKATKQLRTHVAELGGITWPDSKTHHKALTTTAVWCWHENRCTDQWDRVKNTEMNGAFTAN